MPEYELRLRFTAADAAQADRLAQAWAGTCAAEYGTRYAGCDSVLSRQDKIEAAVREHFVPRFLHDPYCGWCGTAIFADFEDNFHDRHGDFDCPASEDRTHEPAEACLTGGSAAFTKKPPAATAAPAPLRRRQHEDVRTPPP